MSSEAGALEPGINAFGALRAQPDVRIRQRIDLLDDSAPIPQAYSSVLQNKAFHRTRTSLDSTFLFIDPRSDVEWTVFELDAMCLTMG